ncbi:MAG: ATP synthase subunit I [Acidobacteriota bacterium]
MTRLNQIALVLLALLTAGAVLLFDWAMALSVLIGGVLSVINFRWMSAGVDRLLVQEKSLGTGSVLAKFLGRLLLIFITFFVIIRTSFLSAMGALVGFSVFVLSGIVEAILTAYSAYRQSVKSR